MIDSNSDEMGIEREYPRIDVPEKPFLITLNEDYVAYQLPISVKAVLLWGDLVPLLKNERDEWELPGGRLEMGESLAECLTREVREEIGWDITFTNPFHAWIYPVKPDEHVLVLSYFERYKGDEPPRLSAEHQALVLASPREIRGLQMPNPYKEAIDLALSSSPDIYH